ncbi:FtsK/SpoIIIE domain-containing protein [Caulobacter sp. UNC358MFTsu5.1]|uniref:FtsK/SpoIIIE domain-containing protein n=1 Tax=Caulobacter sp. UNC358MFTsu5.1 TaxID=1449049 RepID=UPI0004A6B6FF|nr:FtsK/SpoIIIE domain-containing protein [Caulobacter sp. UNC358MFTsu5.1]
MNALELIGAAGVALLKHRLAGHLPDDGIARFLLDRLTGEQVAAVVGAVLADPIGSQIRVLVPRSLVEGFGLPEEVITDERTTRMRNVNHDRPALLLANADDDQGESLLHLTLIGAKQLTESPDFWVEPASRGLGLPDDQIAAWNAALKGLMQAEDWPLSHVARFVATTRAGLVEHGHTIPQALGWALPAVQLPRDTGAFLGLKSKDQDQSARWRRLFDKLISDRKPLMAKQRSNRQVIEPEELRAQFDAVQSDLSAEVQAAMLAFIAAPTGWNDAARDLSAFEWESENVSLLFSGLKTKKSNLAKETISFFDYEKPDALNDTERGYLDQLGSRSLRDVRDDDREFFEAHREDIDRTLRAKWERFIFGRPLECTDFIDGLMSTIERLFAQAPDLIGPRRLTIRCARRTRKSLLDLNADVGLAFAARYRGLPALLGDQITWDAPNLLEYRDVLDRARTDKKYRRNDSTARANLQLKFDLTLSGGISAPATVQLIWTATPSAIGLELPDDLERLRQRPFVRATVARQSVSRKGALQHVSLADVSTMQPAFAQDSGSLVPRATLGEDLFKSFPSALKAAVDEGRLAASAGLEIGESWTAWTTGYRAALEAWSDRGAADEAILNQADAYSVLLDRLTRQAMGDLNRQALLEPVLAVGCVAVTGGSPSAIVTPWHPMRLVGTAVKLRAFAGLVRHLLLAEQVNFGDSRLFFADIRDELSHPFYPEVAVGYAGAEAVLLVETSTVNDYSLMERPVRGPTEAATDVDPADAARQIRQLVDRYLDLQPHERSNLSIMLYNCDAAGLPLAAVNALSSMQDEGEIHCNVLVRHRDRKRLERVYSDLLEQSNADADAVVVSETSRTFMSKLRIGVSLEGATSPEADGERSVDIAFLHDLVSRQAQETWIPVSSESADPSLLDHVPPRWSYRRVTAEDELKATAFLTCPRQPKAGWTYVDAVAAIVRKQAPETGQHFLPARQISFQTQALKAAFDEAHSLAEWVATYDDLLDKRQLAALGVNVIRYRRQRTHGRNMVVSSTSELRVLHVLVRRRLTELSLGLDPARLDTLAQNLIVDANAISGDIVLRAAKRGVSAGELIGLVLSRALIAEEIATGSTVAWFLLDDYAQWLGQKEEGLADILALSVEEDENGALRLRALVSEAKYTSEEGAAEAIRKSRQQLQHTVKRMDEALFGDPGRLDRDLWLSRIADLLLDGTTAVGSTAKLERVRDALRKGEASIDLRGYSHVFLSTSSAATPTLGEQEQVSDVHLGLQEVYHRDSVRRLLLAYEAGSALAPIRESLGELRLWSQEGYRHPAPRVRWTGDQQDTSTSHVPPQDPSSSPPDAPPAPPTGPTSPSPTDGAAGAPLPTSTAHAEDATPAGREIPVHRNLGSQLEIEQARSTTTPESPEAASALTTEGLQASDNGSAASPAATPSAALDKPSPVALAHPPLVAQAGLAFQTLVESRAAPGGAPSADDQAWLEATAQKLRTALLGYRLQAKILGSRLTPNAALIRFQGTDLLRVEDIESKQSALLTTHALRLISVSGSPGEIVVGVARPQRQTVSLWDVWARREINRNAAGLNTSFVLGLRELDGEILYLNLGGPFAGGTQHEPHTLVAGATGSGKSVLIQAMILDIAATNSSRLARIHLIDPKMGVDYGALERLPHVQDGVVVDQARAMEVMEETVAEMERRYTLFRAAKARDLKTYNTSVSSGERLPMIFLIHDEFAEWMLSDDYKEAVSANVSRLGVKARAAGIHLIFAAQRPDATVMPMQLRDNLGNRLILKVASVGTSEIALGSKGAEQLLGLGHLAARLSGEPGLVYAQAPYLSDDDIERAVDAIIADNS